MRKKGAGRKPAEVLLEIRAQDGVVELTAAWVEDKRARFPEADVLRVAEAYRDLCEADPEERTTVWGLERRLTRLIREQGRGAAIEETREPPTGTTPRPRSK